MCHWVQCLEWLTFFYCFVPATDLSTVHALVHLIHITSNRGRWCYPSLHRWGNPRPERLTCTKIHSEKVVPPGHKSKRLALEATLLINQCPKLPLEISDIFNFLRVHWKKLHRQASDQLWGGNLGLTDFAYTWKFTSGAFTSWKMHFSIALCYGLLGALALKI